jgi:hypothetical protein
MIARAGRTPVSKRRPTRRRLAGVVVTGAASVTILFGPAGVATAEDCPITDLTCAAQDVGGTHEHTVDGSLHNAEDGVSTAVDTVGSTLGGLTDTVGQPPGRGGGGGSGDNDGGGANHHGGGSANGSNRSSGSARPGVQTHAGGTLVEIATAIDGQAVADASSADTADQRPGTIGLPEAAAGIALSLLIVLGAVLLFMTIQARLDRRDPKLALAPVTADVVTFA